MNSTDLDGRGFGSWSAFALASEALLLKQIPKSAGVYCMRFPTPQSRLRGESDIAYIGRASNQGGLRGRIRQYFHPGWRQSTNSATKARLDEGIVLELGYALTPGVGDAADLESELLLAFEAEHGERPPFNKQAALAHLRKRWAWAAGVVDPHAEHFELRYGSAKDSAWPAWEPIARVGPATRRIFSVEFIGGPKEPPTSGVLAAVTRELDFYLVEHGDEDPWKYAQYHCSTASNAHSDVHWAFYPAGTSGSAE